MAAGLEIRTTVENPEIVSNRRELAMVTLIGINRPMVPALADEEARLAARSGAA